MRILRSILYIFSIIVLAGAVDGITGGKFHIHELLSKIPLYPHSPALGIALSVAAFIAAEYVSYISGEPPVILHVAALIARIVLAVSLGVCIASFFGIIISILSGTGQLRGLTDHNPILLWKTGIPWISALLWFALFCGAFILYIRLNPETAGHRWEIIRDRLRFEDLEEEISGGRPITRGERMGPSMQRLMSRGIRPIYVERTIAEPLGRLAGDVGLLNIFVDCPSAMWPEEEIMSQLQSVRVALKWLEGEARGRVTLKFKDLGHVRAPNAGWPAADRGRISAKELSDQVLEMLGGIGIGSLNDLHYYLQRYSDEPGNITLFHFYLRGGSWCLPTLHPSIGIAYCFHRHDPELARPYFLEDEDIRHFPLLSSIIAHLILHMFGATDKPVHDVHPNIDIMSAVSLDIKDLLIGFKTGKEIGW